MPFPFRKDAKTNSSTRSSQMGSVDDRTERGVFFSPPQSPRSACSLHYSMHPPAGSSAFRMPSVNPGIEGESGRTPDGVPVQLRHPASPQDPMRSHPIRISSAPRKSGPPSFSPPCSPTAVSTYERKFPYGAPSPPPASPLPTLPFLPMSSSPAPEVETSSEPGLPLVLENDSDGDSVSSFPLLPKRLSVVSRSPTSSEPERPGRRRTHLPRPLAMYVPEDHRSSSPPTLTLQTRARLST
jgi:hypothetical protein